MSQKGSWYPQKDDSENALAATINLIEQLGAPVTRTTMRRTLTEHPDYPSLSAISDALKDWGVDSLAVQIPIETLPEAVFPAIAHLQRGEQGHFVVVTELGDDQIALIDPAVGLRRISTDEFAREWTGALLMAESGEIAGEENFKEKRRSEKLQVLRRLSLVAGTVALVVIGAWLGILSSGQAWLSWSILWGLKAVGVGVSVLLIMKTLAVSNPLLNRFCGAGSKVNCDSVLHSPAAKLFGWLSMADLGLIYFFGGLWALQVAALAGVLTPVAAALFVLSLLALPYTVFSFYYQARVVRQWCPLCIIVQALFWCEVGAHLAGKTTLTTDWGAIPTLLFISAFTLPALVWLALRPQLNHAVQVAPMRRQLEGFRRHPRIFAQLLSEAPEVDMGNLESELVFGPLEAPMTLTLVTNPYCAGCAAAHEKVERLLQEFPEHLRIVVRIAGGEKGAWVAQHVIAHQLGSDAAAAQRVLQAWYRQGHQDLERWKKEHPLPSGVLDEASLKKSLELAMAHSQWAQENGIRVTPSFFFQGRRIPEVYSIDELRRYLRAVVAQSEEE